MLEAYQQRMNEAIELPIQAVRLGNGCCVEQAILDLRTQEIVQHRLAARGSAPGQDLSVISHAAELAAGGQTVTAALSPSSVGDPLVLRHLEFCLLEMDVDPTRVGLEVAWATLNHPRSGRRRFVERLHQLGCELVLDDSGTAVGAFTYLPVDYLTIDLALLRGHPATGEMIEATVELADSFGMGSIAHGVESDADLDAVQAGGIGLAMGDQIAPPVDIECSDPRCSSPWWLA